MEVKCDGDIVVGVVGIVGIVASIWLFIIFVAVIGVVVNIIIVVGVVVLGGVDCGVVGGIDIGVVGVVVLLLSRDVFVWSGGGGFWLVGTVPKYQVLSCRAEKVRSRNGVLLTNTRSECIKRGNVE